MVFSIDHVSNIGVCLDAIYRSIPLVRWPHDPHPCFSFIPFQHSTTRCRAGDSSLTSCLLRQLHQHGIKHSRALEHDCSFLPIISKPHRVCLLFRGEEDLYPRLEPDEAAKAETLKQQEAISADRGTALPSYVSARHVVRNQANFPTRAEAESAGAECLALYEKNKADHAYTAAWVRAIDDNNVASGKVASGPRSDIQSADPYKASNYVDIREGKEYFPTRQELLSANYPRTTLLLLRRGRSRHQPM